jgi:hypothetical protein
VEDRHAHHSDPYDEGDDVTVLFWPIGLIKHGKNVEIKEGTPILAYVDQDFTVPTPK